MKKWAILAMPKAGEGRLIRDTVEASTEASARKWFQSRHNDAGEILHIGEVMDKRKVKQTAQA